MDMIFLCILGLIGLALFLVWIYSLILKQRNLARIDKIIQQCEDKLYKKVKGQAEAIQAKISQAEIVKGREEELADFDLHVTEIMLKKEAKKEK